MNFKNAITEFKSMLRDSGGELAKLTRLLRNRLHLNQEALGALAGVHRNAITRLESGRCNDPARWLSELFFVLLACRERTLHKDIVALREHAKKNLPIQATEENSALFGEFLRLSESCSGNIATLSKEIRRRYGLTQEEFAELLGADRTAVTHLEGAKHKYPERLLADLYLSFLLLNEQELREEVYSLRREKVRALSEGRAEKDGVPKTAPGVVHAAAKEEDAKYPAPGDNEEPGGTGQWSTPETRVPVTEPVTAGFAPNAADFDEQAKLRKYGFRTRQELYGAMRNEDLTLEEKRRLALIDGLWAEELKKKEALKVVRMQMQTVRARIMRELFDRGRDTQAVFIRASNSYRKGLSIAEISQEHNGYLSLPFCSFWEKRGFDPVKFLTWKPLEEEIHEIYRDFEPEFKMNSLEYRFRPKKNPSADRPETEERKKSLATLLKEWFPQLAEEIRD
jgi:DNA-binding XRE family transcriptional regulator